MTDMEKSVDELIRRSMKIDEQNLEYLERQKENNKVAIYLLLGMILILVVLLSLMGGYYIGYHSAMNEVTEKIVLTAIGLE